jgi:hypothetical protein
MARSNVAQLWNGECCCMQQTYLSGHATHATTTVNPLPFVSVQSRLVSKLSYYYQGPPDLHMVAQVILQWELQATTPTCGCYSPEYVLCLRPTDQD